MFGSFFSSFGGAIGNAFGGGIFSSIGRFAGKMLGEYLDPKLTLCYSKYAKNSYYTAMFYSEALHNIS